MTVKILQFHNIKYLTKTLPSVKWNKIQLLIKKMSTLPKKLTFLYHAIVYFQTSILLYKLAKQIKFSRTCNVNISKIANTNIILFGFD